ncbi:MAG: glycerol kinase GlpK [Tannerellaceae bacterium]|jgi:glycerol kinase|nr:glycerol kinase GlpK [Tannerellaceae bacterium]
MKNKVIAIDQSTSATKAMLFSGQCKLIRRSNVCHEQYYPKAGWVEHDAEEIYRNVLLSVGKLMDAEPAGENNDYSLCITNQRETVVVWNKDTGKPVYNAIVWQCLRGAAICNRLKEEGHSQMVREKTGLLIDPYFSASGVKWILDNVEGARRYAAKGLLLMGTIDSWLIWKLTNGRVHATDYTNASRTLLFNIHTLDWDDDMLNLFTVPRSMMPQPHPCDSVFGETTVGGIFKRPVCIAGAIGDSHAALAGQMCFEEGLGKATYGTGSSVMVNTGGKAVAAPKGLVTSIGFHALGKISYAFEGNIHCTGATINWIENQLGIISSPAEIECMVSQIGCNDGVYFVPAFTGLGAPWWQPDVKAAIFGMTLATGKMHIIRAAIESIAYQVNDLVKTMQQSVTLKELRADGGGTKNNLLMQFQADLLRTPVNCLDIEEASALGAVIMNGFARNVWSAFADIQAMSTYGSGKLFLPEVSEDIMNTAYTGWLNAVKQLIK